MYLYGALLTQDKKTCEMIDRNFASKLKALMECRSRGYMRDSSSVPFASGSRGVDLWNAGVEEEEEVPGAEALQLAELHGMFGHK